MAKLLQEDGSSFIQNEDESGDDILLEQEFIEGDIIDVGGRYIIILRRKRR